MYKLIATVNYVIRFIPTDVIFISQPMFFLQSQLYINHAVNVQSLIKEMFIHYYLLQSYSLQSIISLK